MREYKCHMFTDIVHTYGLIIRCRSALQARLIEFADMVRSHRC